MPARTAGIAWKLGVEIELLAPRGVSRRSLADACAAQCGGTVRTVWHQDSEPSKVPGRPVFHNLTPGFEAIDRHQQLIVRCVDDLTLQADLDRQAPPREGWWRVVSDDQRLLRMMSLHIDPALPLPQAMLPLVPIFQGQLLPAEGGIYRILDSAGAPLALAAPLPGERERPCELITPPISSHHFQRIDALLQVARRLDFTLPAEGATHLHFDGAALCDSATLASVVNLLSAWRGRLRRLCATPASFRRVGEWPAELLATVNADGFRNLSCEAALAQLGRLGLSKYCDFNLKNLVHPRGELRTLEIRILPATLDGRQVVAAAELFAAILRHCQRTLIPAGEANLAWNAGEVAAFLDQLQLTKSGYRYWTEALARCSGGD